MKGKYEKLIENLGEGRVKKNVPLAGYTTFKTGGPADLFYEAKSSGDLIKAVGSAHKLGIPIFILGGGSNVLVGDKGFKGLVVRVKNSKVKMQKCNSKSKIFAEAGVPLSRLVQLAKEKSLTGLEFAAGVPGTLGGAVYGNAGEPEVGLGDRVASVTLMMPDGKVKVVDRRWMEFGYRKSRLGKYSPARRPIILSVVLQLEDGERSRIEHSVQERWKRRRQAFPVEPSAGCIFKNPKSYPAGFLIDRCGLKGRRIGKAQISKKHANFIVNLGEASAADVLGLIRLCKDKVREKFGLELEEEICRVGEL